MKRSAFSVIGLAGLALLAYYVFTQESVTEYNQPQIITEVLEPEWATDAEAVEAAQAVIRRKELERELMDLKNSWASTTAVYEREKDTYLSKKEEIEKELGTY